MKLKKNFVMHDTGRETVLVPMGGTEFSGMVRGNRTLGVILSLLKEETTEAQLVSAMRDRFNAPEDVLERDVKRALGELRRIGALDE